MILLVAVVAILAFGVYKMTITTEGDKTEITKCADAENTLTVQSYSALPGASDPSSPTITCGVNGGPVTTSVTSGTTKFPVGTDLQCLVSKSDYIDVAFDSEMECGGLIEAVPMYYSTSDNPSVRIKNDDGDFMTDNVAGGATNQTDVSAGETLTLEVEFQGTSTEASGDGVYVVEFPAGSSGNITKVEMAGLSQVAIPSTHSLQNANSKAVAFKVPSIKGGDKKTYAMQVVLTASKDLMGGTYTDWYGGQEFIDDDKTIKWGVEDSDGTAKYENTGDYDFYINAA